MPRQRKPPGPTANGGYRPGGPPGGALAPGKPYGETTQQMQALNAVPMAPSPTAGPGPPPSPGGPGPALPPVPDGAAPPAAGLGAALQAALGASPPPPGGLLRPTERPNEPLTAGLSTGDGPGPEMLGQTPNPVVDTLQRVADLTGDPALAQVAARARTMGGQ